MKSDELVRRISNGEVKRGTEIIIYIDGEEAESTLYKGENIGLEYKKNKVPVNNFMLLNNDITFEIIEEPKGWFKPKYDEKYWYIDTYKKIHCLYWNDSEFDLYRYNDHNVFRTGEEAHRFLNYKNALKEAEKPFVDGEFNFFAYIYTVSGKLELGCSETCIHQGIPYLGQDEKVAQAFIDKWKDCILKYEFGIFE